MWSKGPFKSYSEDLGVHFERSIIIKNKLQNKIPLASEYTEHITIEFGKENLHND